MASIGRVLGDRSVMYKYLNPNMLSFITYKTAMDKSTLKIYLLDTVTGNILYSTAVLGVGPISPNDPYHPRSSVNIIQVENWVVATYYNHGIDHVPVIPVFHMSPGDRSDEKGRRTKKKVEINNAVGLDSKGVEVLVLEIFETSTPNARGTEDG